MVHDRANTDKLGVAHTKKKINNNNNIKTAEYSGKRHRTYDIKKKKEKARRHVGQNFVSLR